MHDVIEVCTLYRHSEYMSWKKYEGLHGADVYIDVYNAHSMWSVQVWCKPVCGTRYRERAAATPPAGSHQHAALCSAQRTCLIPQGGERKSGWVLLNDLPLTGRFPRKLHHLAWQFASTGSCHTAITQFRSWFLCPNGPCFPQVQGMKGGWCWLRKFWASLCWVSWLLASIYPEPTVCQAP